MNKNSQNAILPLGEAELSFRARCLLALGIPTMALAAPAEDHWSKDADKDEIATLEQARSLIDEEDYAGALHILEPLAQTSPANADIFNLLGFAYRNSGQLELGAAHYERALYLKPDHLGALEYQGELFLITGHLDKAQGNLRRLDALCSSPCEERDELAEAIQVWQAKQSARKN